MKIENLIKKLLIVVMMLFMIVSLTGCSNNNENVTVEDDNTDEVVQEEKEVKVETSGDYTKWPAGVYNAYGIPEYTFGEVAFAVPYDEKGEVNLNTSISELRAYINILRTKDFKISENDLEELNEYDPMDENDVVEGLSGKIYAPTKGAGYIISYHYTELANEQTVSAYSFEGMEEDYTFNANCSISLEIEEYPEENIEKDLLTKYGLTDEDVLPKFKVYVAEKAENGEERTVVNFDFGYDCELSEEDVHTYILQLAKACEKISDDGKIYDTSDTTLTVDDSFSDPVFVYKYQGVEYRVVCEFEKGLTGGNGYLIIENN